MERFVLRKQNCFVTKQALRMLTSDIEQAYDKISEFIRGYTNGEWRLVKNQFTLAVECTVQDSDFRVISRVNQKRAILFIQKRGCGYIITEEDNNTEDYDY